MARPDEFGQVWTNLDKFERVWTSLDKLDQSGPCWSQLNSYVH